MTLKILVKIIKNKLVYQNKKCLSKDLLIIFYQAIKE